MIIHSPIVSGSLTFANGATFTLPTGGVYSGSFSGSYQGITFAGGTFTGDGSGLTFGGTGIISGSSQLTTDFDARYLNTGGDGIVSSSAQVITLLPTGTISGSSQVDLTATTNYASGILTRLNAVGVFSGSSQVTLSATTGYSANRYVDHTAVSITAGTGLSGGGDISTTRTLAIDTAITATVTGSQTLTNKTISGASNTLSNIGNSSLSNSAITIAGTSTSLGDSITAATILNGTNVVSGSAQIVGILSALNTFSASEETKNATLGTYTGSIDSKFSTLATTSGSLLSSQTNLNTYTGSLLGAFQVTGSRVNFLGDVVVYGTQSIINSQNVQIADNILYLSPTASIDNDLGIVGHYNDGTYRHAGIFMDASDGHSWKVFNSLTDETIGTVNTSGTGFTLADFKAGAITGTSFTGNINSTNGVVSGSSQIAFSGVTGTVSNGQLANSSVTVTAGTGLSGGGAVSLGSSVTLTNAGVTSNVAGSGISVSGATGAVTITNTGVTSAVAGTGVSVSGATGAVTISIGQSVATSANAQFNSLGIGMAASATAGRIDATNDIVAYSSSDIRFKENITPIENAIDKINQIGGYTYDWKEENKIEHGYEGNDVGVIAQEIEAVLPQLVQTRESGYKAVKYDKLVALLIEGIKEQQYQIDELRNKIEKLENGK